MSCSEQERDNEMPFNWSTIICLFVVIVIVIIVIFLHLIERQLSKPILVIIIFDGNRGNEKRKKVENEIIKSLWWRFMSSVENLSFLLPAHFFVMMSALAGDFNFPT